MKIKPFRGLIIFPLFCLLFLLSVNSQEKRGQMSDIVNPDHPGGLVRVEIKSKTDNHIQPAIFYKSKTRRKKPLIVSLHSWSGDYTQKDPLALKIQELDWNYIHPDFRGRNNNPDACGSPLVISDIEDAIDYALKNANVNKKEIHIIGGSGGGHATLLCYMKVGHSINSFSAWNPITNLADWYYESVGRGNRYADDIFKATSSEENLNIDEALSRSPAFMDYPGRIRKNARLFIYHGIHDGYLGSVPVTHSLHFYNELIKKIDPEEREALISDNDIMDLLVKRCFPETMADTEMIGDRKIHYKRNYRNIQILIFEGQHEMLNQVTLELIPAKE